MNEILLKGLSPWAQNQKRQNIQETEKAFVRNIDAYTGYIYISGKAWQIEADKSCNNSKTSQDYKRHFKKCFMVVKHPHRQLQFILQPLKIVHHSCEYTNAARRSC